MIDIHCHILPGIDDGAKTMDEAVAMATLAAADGILTIVATPHVNNTLHPPEEIALLVQELNTELRQRKIAVNIVAGADVSSLIPAQHAAGYAINGSRYMLLEFPHTHLPKTARDTLFQLNTHGITPIITHPERNPSIASDPGLLLDLLTSNALVQVTADSLTGEFGDQARQCAEYLLKKNAVHFIASDAHSTTSRRPQLSHGLKAAAKIIGDIAAERLVMTNPLAVVSGLPMY